MCSRPLPEEVVAVVVVAKVPVSRVGAESGRGGVGGGPGGDMEADRLAGAPVLPCTEVRGVTGTRGGSCPAVPMVLTLAGRSHLRDV